MIKKLKEGIGNSGNIKQKTKILTGTAKSADFLFKNTGNMTHRDAIKALYSAQAQIPSLTASTQPGMLCIYETLYL